MNKVVLGFTIVSGILSLGFLIAVLVITFWEPTIQTSFDCTTEKCSTYLSNLKANNTQENAIALKICSCKFCTNTYTDDTCTCMTSKCNQELAKDISVPQNISNIATCMTNNCANSSNPPINSNST